MWHELERTEGGKELAKSFEFADFSEAFAFCDLLDFL
jgi:pterin-4a-carbinolamine dehydratase